MAGSAEPAKPCSVRIPLFVVRLFGNTARATLLIILASCSSFDETAPSVPVVDRTTRPFATTAPIDFRPGPMLHVCQGMRVSNAPASDRGGRIRNYAPYVEIAGQRLAAAPVHNACLSSGYGVRGNRLHTGVDYHQRPGGPVYAAADGTVVEISHAGWFGGNGFGNMLLLDHGGGVFTRYAHLANFAAQIELGRAVAFGARLGTMGSTGRSQGVHLHYEILTGPYHPVRKSYGLKAHDPFRLMRSYRR